MFKLKHSVVRRRYSDFVWLKRELERESKVLVPTLPPQALSRQMPWVSEAKGMFADDFLEERRRGLEEFIRKCVLLHASFM